MAGDLFVEGAGLKLLITRYHGEGERSANFGADLSWNLERDVVEYAKEVLANPAVKLAGIRPEDLQVHYIPCLVNGHDEARALGRAWNADVVLWGQAYASIDTESSVKAVARDIERRWAKAKNISLASNNIIKGDPKTVEITGIEIQPSTSSRFKTWLTVIPWTGLDAASEYKGAEPLDNTMDLGFPMLATEKPLALFHTLLAMDAEQRGRYQAAAMLFEEVQTMPGFPLEHPDIERRIGKSYLYAGKPKLGLAALEKALSSCYEDDLHCNYAGLSTLGWASARLGERSRALEFYNKALPLLRRASDIAGEAKILNNIGLLHRELGNKQKALEFLQKALPLLDMGGDLFEKAVVLNNIGVVYFSLGMSQDSCRLRVTRFS